MKRHLLLAFGLFVALIGACTSRPEVAGAGDREALTRYMETYPEAHLQDIYKSCFQNVFGVAHLISDTQACVAYIESEMAAMTGEGRVCPDYEYTLPDSHFVRVDLHCVADGRVPRELMVALLMESAATPASMTQEAWVTRWEALKAAADELSPRPQDYEADAQEIDSLLAAGDYVMHHSRHYNAVYHPHYRLIRRDLFERHIRPLL